jgi:hypothetical protein
MTVKTLGDVVGQMVSWDQGSQGVLKGKLELRPDTQFVRYDEQGKEVTRDILIYRVFVQGQANFWYGLGVVGSQFDRGCTVEGNNNHLTYRAA